MGGAVDAVEEDHAVGVVVRIGGVHRLAVGVGVPETPALGVAVLGILDRPHLVAVPWAVQGDVQGVHARGHFRAVGYGVAIGVGIAWIRPGHQLGEVVEPVAVGVGVGDVGAEVELVEVGDGVAIEVAGGIGRIGRIESRLHLDRVRDEIAVGIGIGGEHDVVDLADAADVDAVDRLQFGRGLAGGEVGDEVAVERGPLTDARRRAERHADILAAGHDGVGGMIGEEPVPDGSLAAHVDDVARSEIEPPRELEAALFGRGQDQAEERVTGRAFGGEGDDPVVRIVRIGVVQQGAPRAGDDGPASGGAILRILRYPRSS